jgi:putative ABC transport system permease protein
MGAPGVVVIDDVMARQAFGGQDPVGKRIWVDAMGSGPVTVVGVVGHVRYWGLAADDQSPVRAQLYYPFAQVPDNLVRRWSELMSIAIRTDVEPLSLLPELRRNFRGDTGDQVIYQVRTLEQLASEGLAQQRFLVALFGVFAGLALLLACVGVYGVLSYLTSERVPEMGVRLALGAKAGAVVWLVLRQSLGMIALGAAFGAAAAFAANRLLQRLVEGMQPGGLATSAVMIAILASAALLASYLPARRAGRIDPMKALRQN